MGILLVSPFLPHRRALHAGGRFVAWLLEELGRRHDLFLVTRVSPDEAPHLEEVREACREVRPLFHEIPSGAPGRGAERIVSYVRLGRDAARWVGERRFDLVQVEHVEAAVAFRPKSGTPWILDCHDILTKPKERVYRSSEGIPRMKGWLAYQAYRAMEREVLRRCSMAFVRSGIDREYLEALGANVPIRIVPHPCGLDLSGGERRHDERTILFLGALHRPLNVDAVLFFARKVFPLVRENFPEARFVVAGADPPEVLKGLDSESGGIRVVGPVDTVEPSYLSATVFVAPILVGGGIIVKILDAMAAGVPVVTTSFGNEGICAEPGYDILVADDPEDFARQVALLLKDPEANRRIGENGRAFVRRSFGREAIVETIFGAYRQILGCDPHTGAVS